MTTETDDLVKRLRDVENEGITGSDRFHLRNEAADTIERLQREHCKDCCCAQSWRALGVTGYTGMSIPEHIERLQRDLRECVELLEWAGEQLVVIGLEGGSLCQKISKAVARLKEKP